MRVWAIRGVQFGGFTRRFLTGLPAMFLAGMKVLKAIRLRGGKTSAFIRFGDCGSAHACEVITVQGRTRFSPLVGDQRRQQGRNLRENY
jgi:hypothetical protein